MALPVAGFVMAGLYDPRFYIVALALALVIYPGIVSLLYFNYGLRPQAAFSLIPHQIKIRCEMIEITYQKSEDHTAPPARTLYIDQISTVTDTGQSIVLTLTTGKYDVEIIPISAFKQGEAKEALRLLSEKK